MSGFFRVLRHYKLQILILIMIVLIVALLVHSCSLRDGAASSGGTSSGTSTGSTNVGGSSSGTSGSTSSSDTSGSTSSPGTSGSTSSPGTQQSGGSSNDGASSGTSSGDSQSSEVTVDPEKQARASFIVCIDPGHGYEDPGCDSDFLGEEFSEKTITLSISLMLRDYLEELGFTVIMTRDSDVIPDDLPPNRLGMYTLGSEPRCSVANSGNADLNISIHCNAYDVNPNVSGTRLYYYENNHDLADELTDMVSFGIFKTLTENCSIYRTVRGQTFAAIRDVYMPSLLIETAFVTNEQDAEKLKDHEWQDGFAEGVAAGILDFYNTYGEQTA